MSIDYTNNAAGSLLQTQGQGFNVPVPGIDPAFYRLLAERKAQREEPVYRRIAAPLRGPRMMPDDRQEKYMQLLRDRDQTLQMQARQHAPVDIHATPGAMGVQYAGLADPYQMNSYQRAAYLPQNSQMSGDINALPGATPSPDKPQLPEEEEPFLKRYFRDFGGLPGRS